MWSRVIGHRGAEPGAVVLLGATGLGVRAAFLSRQTGGLDADSATIGLMARHVLEGEHYAFFWGQGYMGSLEAYVVALFFVLLGQGDVALQLAPLAFSVGFTIAAYAWARRLGGPPAALATLALLAVGPPTLTLWQITPRGGYAEMLALGMLVLLLASRLGDAAADGAGRRWVALGLVAGLAFWTHLLSVVYLAAAAGYLLLRDPHRLRCRGPWLAVAFFALGSAPLWLYNVTGRFLTFTVLTPARPLDLVGNLTVALADNLPKLLGARALTHGEALLPGPVLLVVVGVPLAALVWLAVHLGCALAAGRRPPASMAAVILAATAAAVLLTPYGGVASQRYWLPVLSVLPVIVGLWLARLPRPFACLLLVLLGTTHLASHLAFVPDARPDHQALGEALAQAGVRHAYADYWVAAPLTYYSDGTLTVADLQGAWYPMEERPDFSTLPAVILPGADRAYGDTLRLAGIRFAEHRVGRFVIYQPTALPRDRRQPLGRQTWTADAWPNGADAWKSLDGDPESRWSSGGPQRAGMWFQVDLGSEVPVSGLHIGVGRYATDFPRAIGVEVSPDGVTWRTVAAAEHGLRPGVRVVGDAFRHDPESTDHDIRFPPVETRFVRLSIPSPPTSPVETRFDWSIVELRLFTPADASDGTPASG